MAQLQKFRLPRQQLEVLGHGFAKANAGVEQDTLARYAQRAQAAGMVSQKILDHAQGGTHHGLHLHGGGLGMHVHQAHTALAMRGHRLGRTGLAQGPNVVDDVGTSVQSRLHHRRFAGVHRDRHLPTHRRFHHGLDAGPFGLGIHGGGPWPRRLTPDIQNLCALAQQALGMGDSSRSMGVLAPVGKRVGGDVDDAHHPRFGQVKVKPRGLPKRRMGPKPHVVVIHALAQAVDAAGLVVAAALPPPSPPDGGGVRATQCLWGLGVRPAMMSLS